MQIKEFEKRFSGHIPRLLGAKAAFAMLVPLVYEKGEPSLLFEVRADTLNRQPGEVCFPGGRMETGETPLQCALRETEEELSLPAASIHPLAELDYVYHQSGTLIYPILAKIRARDLRKDLRCSTAEVKETFLVPFSFFLNTRPMLYTYDLEPQIPDDCPYHLIGFEGSYPWRPGKIDVPIYLYENHAIWGLTGRICMALAQQMAQPAAKTAGIYQHIEHPIAPLYQKDSRILILGSFPSVKSREGMFFYHHPQNRFWKVLAALTGEDAPSSIEEKRSMLLRHHIALWDVIHSCDIIGSSDSSIKNVVPNDLRPILDAAPIRQIYTNGGTAGRLYRKYIEPELGRPCTVLPSTSPANASYTLDKLIIHWQQAIGVPL